MMWSLWQGGLSTDVTRYMVVKLSVGLVQCGLCTEVSLGGGHYAMVLP